MGLLYHPREYIGRRLTDLTPEKLTAFEHHCAQLTELVMLNQQEGDIKFTNDSDLELDVRMQFQISSEGVWIPVRWCCSGAEDPTPFGLKRSLLMGKVFDDDPRDLRVLLGSVKDIDDPDRLVVRMEIEEPNSEEIWVKLFTERIVTHDD